MQNVLFNLKSRLKASAIHLLFSLILLLISALLITTQWYPSPYFTASGGLKGLNIIIFGLVLGPLLTLIIYNYKKTCQAIFIDLSIIILLQASTLFWLISNIYNERPLAIAFFEDRFYTVPAKVLTSQDIKLNNFGLQKPFFIYVKKPDSITGINEVLKRMQEEGYAPHQQIELYQPIKNNIHKIFKHSIDMTEIINKNKLMKEALYQLLSDTHTQLNKNYYLILESKYHNVILVYNQNKKFIGSINAPYKSK